METEDREEQPWKVSSPMEVTPLGTLILEINRLSLKDGRSVMPSGKITRYVLVAPTKNAFGKAVKPCKNSIVVKDVGISDQLDTLNRLFIVKPVTLSEIFRVSRDAQPSRAPATLVTEAGMERDVMFFLSAKAPASIATTGFPSIEEGISTSRSDPTYLRIVREPSML